MLQYLFDAWAWIKAQAFLNIILLLTLIAAGLIYLNFYPLTFERNATRTENFVEIDENTQYVVSTTFTEKGAKLQIESHSYVTQIKKPDPKEKSATAPETALQTQAQ